MRYLLACLVATLLIGVGNASAQQMYAGVAGGYAFETFDVPAEVDDWLEFDNSWAMYAYFGYCLQENLAVQADLGRCFGFPPEESDSILDEDDLEVTVWTMIVSAKYSIQTEYVATPFVIGGIGWGWYEAKQEIPGVDDEDEAEIDDSGFVIRIGGGVDYKISEVLTLTADIGYVMSFGDVEDLNFIDVKVGIGYTFK